MATFTCAISGLTAGGLDHSDGDLEDLPVGWARVTVEIRTENPRWADIQKAKAESIAAQLQQVPEDQRQAARAFTALLLDVQFAAIENATPRYLQEDHVVEVSAAEIAGLRETFGLTEEDEE